MGRSYKKAIIIGFAFVLALTFLGAVAPDNVMASSPNHGENHSYMYKGMGKAYFDEPRPSEIIRESQEELSCVKWYYQLHGHRYIRIDRPCHYGTAEFKYERTYRSAIRGVNGYLIPNP